MAHAATVPQTILPTLRLSGSGATPMGYEGGRRFALISSPCRAPQEGSLIAAAGQMIFFIFHGTDHVFVRSGPNIGTGQPPEGIAVNLGAVWWASRKRMPINACTRAFSAETIGIAMKHALIAASIAACLAAFCPAFAQGVNERREAPVARPAQVLPEGQSDPRTPQRSEPAVPQTTGRSFTRDAGSASSAEESSAVAAARRVRAAVGRTLDRTHELSQTASD
jgi:hypothetical protein